METSCDFCNKKVAKSAREMERYTHHFCNRDCYFKHRKLTTKPKTKNMKAQHKIKILAKKLATTRTKQ